MTVSGTGVSVTGITVTGGTTINATFNISNGATLGGRNVTITTEADPSLITVRSQCWVHRSHPSARRRGSRAQLFQ